MNQSVIKSLKIKNFKSIDSLELKGINPFSVFAGANGSGKTNFFDALDFVSRFIRHGVQDALRAHGGYDNIHSVKKSKDFARRFEFEIEVIFTKTYKYKLVVRDLDKIHPKIEEEFIITNICIFKREQNKIIYGIKEENTIDNFSTDASGFLLFSSSEIELLELLRNLRLYRIDPLGASEADKSDQDSSVLKGNGHNLASVLYRLEKNDELRETILEWMEMIVPSIQKVTTEKQQLTGGTAILFKEEGTRKQFPAHIMSDGTIYALSLLVAVLDKPKYGFVLIEEPERGLHPKAIQELIGLIREQASENNPIWMTTHSESVVRQLKLGELWLVDKQQGRTQMKAASSGHLQQEDLASLGMDEAWLSNLLNGGLPW